MTPDHYTQVAELWRSLSGSHTAFKRRGIAVVEAEDHRLSPAGWVGIVSLGDSAVIATPSEFITLVELGLAMSPTIERLTTADGVDDMFGEPAQLLGPAALAYGRGRVEAIKEAEGPVPTSDPAVRRILEQCSPEDRDESDLMRTQSGVFLATDSTGEPVSASGYRLWPKSVAHMSVVTVPAARGRGHGAVAAAAAIGLATSSGLLAQWRAAATNGASQALARSLGLTDLGWQLSFRPRPM